MSPDEPFPLNQFSPRLQCVIRNEFKGRCPSHQEMAEITDAQWLATPSIGPAILRKIRAFGQCDECSIRGLTDVELLERLTDLQEELTLIQRAIRMTIPDCSQPGRPRRSLPRPSASRAASDDRGPIGRSGANQGMSTNCS